MQTPTTGVGRRAYTCDGAGTWNALAVNDTGNLSIAGTATIGTLSVTNNSTVGGNQTVTGNMVINGNTTLGNAATDTVTISGTASIQNIRPANTIVANAACGGYNAGDIAKDVSGIIYSCQGGTWKVVNGGSGYFSPGDGGGYTQATFPPGPLVCHNSNPKTGACSCPAGKSAYTLTQFTDQGMGFPGSYTVRVCE